MLPPLSVYRYGLFLLQVFLVLAFLSSSVYGQKEKLTIRFDNISIKDGLSQSSPNSIFQDSRGLLWIGTEDGLNKFDGYTFQVFKPDQNNRFSISNPRIVSICEDSKGILWIGTHGGGLNKYEPKTGRFYHFMPDNNDSVTLAGSIVYCVKELQPGRLWIGTDGGLSVFDLEGNKFLGVPDIPVLTSLAGVQILSMSATGNGPIWVGTDNGLYRLDPNNALTHYKHNPADLNSLPDNVVNALQGGKNNTLWIGTGNGLASLGATGENLTVYKNLPAPGSAITNNSVKALLEDGNGDIWIGTFGSGLDILNVQTGAITNYSYDYNNPYSLSNNEVLSIFRDHSGIIWVGTNGLDKYNPKKEKFVLYDYVPFSREKLVFRNIHPIYEDPEGLLWIGSKTDGLHLLDRKNKRYSRLLHSPGSQISLSSNRIRAIREYPEGIVWIGTDDQGLDKLMLDENRRPVRIIHYRHKPEDTNSLTSDKIYAIYPDNNGNLLIGTDKGLTKLSADSEQFTQYLPDPGNKNSLSNATVYCIYGDKAGNIWLATDFGVNRFEPASGNFTRFVHNENDSNSLIYNEVLSFLEDSKGNLWIGTYGKGLDRFHMASGNFDHPAGNSQLSTAVVYGILEDDNGNLWLSTNNGIIKYSPLSGEINQFSIEDGLQSNEFNGTSYFKGNSGEMFFGGQYGFNSFFPNEVFKDSIAPGILLSDLQVHNRSVVPGEDSPIDRQISEVKEILLNFKQNNFTLYFSALHFANPSQNNYKYKLEGFDNDWIDAGNKRFVSYTSLPYKTYTFRVIASNSDGIWNEKGLSVKIRIKPPFWATLWFRFLIIATLIASVVYLVRRRLTQEHQQKLLFEKKFEASSRELEEAQAQLEIQHSEIVVQKRELKLREKDQENLLWFNQGLGIFSDLMSKNRDDMAGLCRVFIERLVEYVDAQQGGIFLLNEDSEEIYLELFAHYGYSLDRATTKFRIGEGYVGSCCHSNQFIEVDNLTEKYAEIKSGLGQVFLKHLLLAPLKVNDQCVGVVELGSFRKIKGYRVSFIEKLLETFASTVNTQRANAKLRRLIDHSTSQSRELEAREEQLRMNLEEIMATQEESARREDELIKLAEESATREEMLNQEIEQLKSRIEQITGKSMDT